MRVFRDRLSAWVCSSFPFGFESGMWDLIVLISDHCLSIYFESIYRWPGFRFTSSLKFKVNLKVKVENFTLRKSIF